MVIFHFVCFGVMLFCCLVGFFANKGQKSGRHKVQLNSVCKFIGMKIICSQKEHICNWWLSISIYISVLSSNYFHWVIKTISVLLIPNLKKTQQQNTNPSRPLCHSSVFFSFCFCSHPIFHLLFCILLMLLSLNTEVSKSLEKAFSHRNSSVCKMGWYVKTNVLVEACWLRCVLSRAEVHVWWAGLLSQNAEHWRGQDFAVILGKPCLQVTGRWQQLELASFPKLPSAEGHEFFFPFLN